MSQAVRIDVGDDGVSIRDGAEVRGSFPWGSGEWSLRITDTRVGARQPPMALTGKLVVGVPTEHPRVTSLDRKGRDQDRDLLGLAADDLADPVLLTNPRLDGDLKLHYGPLHAHALTISDGDATRLITEAFRRGFEVRRSLAHVDGVGASELITEITTKRAADTPETVSSR